MSNGARIGVVAATIAVLVLAFILLSPEADDDSNTAETPTTTAPPVTTSAPPATTATTAAPPAPPAADHQPAFRRVRVRAGKPVGGIEKITVKKGARARIEVTSTDTSDEVHLHGYDISRDVKPGSRARFSFDANAEGIFEIELEGSHTQIAELTVEP
jgi:heme/copper-type cytochrome/quinol oxidase subunit 2